MKKTSVATTLPQQKPKTKKALPRRENQGWLGGIDGIHRGLLYGWAIDTTQIDARVILEIQLNGNTVGSVIADVARYDLHDVFAQHYGNGERFDVCHGFVADLGDAQQQNNEEKSLFSIKIANTNVVLPETIERYAEKKPPLSATSLVFSDGALRLHGWAIDYQDEKRPLPIYAVYQNEVIAKTIADLNHPSVRAFRVEGHGFNLDLPLHLANGQKHQVHVVDATGRAINGSPISVCCHAAGVSALFTQSENAPLNRLLQSYENYLPRSIGLSHYADWASLFERPTLSEKSSAIDSDVITRHIGVAVMVLNTTGDENTSLANDELAQSQLSQTKSSLAQQLHQHVELIRPRHRSHNKADFSDQLSTAIDSNNELICCMRLGDALAPHALSSVIEAFTNEHVALVYTDSEYLNQAWFKPAWNPEYAFATDYPLELLVIRKTALHEYLTQNPTPKNYAELAWGMLAQVAEKAQAATIKNHQFPILHLPRVVYQFQSPLTECEKNQRFQAARAALRFLEPASELTAHQGFDQPNSFALRRVQRDLNEQEKQIKVSLIIPTRDYLDLLKACITSLQKFTRWQNLEIIVIDNGSRESATLAYFKRIEKQGIRVLAMPGAFNFADLNNRAVTEATGDIIGLINNDIEALHEGWLEEMMSHLLRPNVGIVGAKLLWPNGMVQHGGVLLGLGNVAGHFGNTLADADLGDHGRNQVLQQVSAVTAACLFLRKADYLAVGGMDKVAFPVAFNDLDLCLKIRSIGKTIIWTPEARLLHAESASRGHEDTPQKKARSQREVANLRERWGHLLLRDPNYHPSLNLDAHSQAYNGLAIPPRIRNARGPFLIESINSATQTEEPEKTSKGAKPNAQTKSKSIIGKHAKKVDTP